MNNKIQESPLTETALLVMLAMYQPNHGYGVMKFVEDKTDGRVVFGPGTLYGAINNLAKKKWIALYNDIEGERKKDYIITDLGREQVKAELKRLEEVYSMGMEIVSTGGIDND